MYIQEKAVYTGFGTVHSFRYLLEVMGDTGKLLSFKLLVGLLRSHLSGGKNQPFPLFTTASEESSMYHGASKFCTSFDQVHLQHSL